MPIRTLQLHFPRTPIYSPLGGSYVYPITTITVLNEEMSLSVPIRQPITNACCSPTDRRNVPRGRKKLVLFLHTYMGQASAPQFSMLEPTAIVFFYKKNEQMYMCMTLEWWGK